MLKPARLARVIDAARRSTRAQLQTTKTPRNAHAPAAPRPAARPNLKAEGVGHATATTTHRDATTRYIDDLREAVATFEDVERAARRVFGGAHPTTTGIGAELRKARAALRAREGDVEPLREAVAAMTPGDA